MREKLNTHSQFRQQDKNPLIRIIVQTWKKLLLEVRYRLSGSVLFSILIHLFFILGYLGIDSLDKPLESPIEEITFIDMNEIEEEPEEIVIEKEQPAVVQNKLPESLPEEEPEPSYQPQEQSSSPITLGKDRIFLDTERKQAPINVQKYESVAGNISKPGDMLNVSSAIGIKKDNRTSKPTALELGKNKDMLLASAAPSNAVTFGKSGKPNIDLNPAKGTISNGSLSNNITPSKPQPVQSKPELKPKTTQTMITGDLANREILEKEIPPFPYWARNKGVGATISLRFTVMPDGSVKETVIVERTSGSLQWDQMVISSLKKWKFVPIKSTGLIQNQSGVITFQFVI